MQCHGIINLDKLLGHYCDMEIKHHPNSRQYNIWSYILELASVNITVTLYKMVHISAFINA